MLSRILEDFATSVWVERVGWTLLHSLWQIFLIVSAYYLLSFQLRKNSAFSRYITGCTALVAILVAPLATFCLLPDQQVAVARVVDQESDDVSPQPLNDISISPNTVESRFAEPALADNSIGVESGAFGPEVSLSSAYVAPTAEPVEVPAEIEKIAAAMRPWLPLITVLWLVGVVLLSMRPVMGCFYVRRLKRFGLSAVPDSVLEACHELMRKMKIQPAVQLFQSSLVHSPVVVGYLRPMILLPASAITGLTAHELELILAHELAHIRKHDYLVNLVQTVIEALLFYHPGMWWMSAQVRRERENCCDDVAVAIGSDRATYIRALTLLEQQRVASPALAATSGSLLSRVRRLVGGPGSEFVYRKSSLWLTALVMFGIAVTTIGFAGTTSDQPDEAKDTLEIVEHDDGKAEAALSFDKLVGQKVAQVVRKAKLPFVDETQIKKIEADFTSFMNNDVPYGTWRVGSSIPKNQRQAILAAIENHGAKHLKISQFPQTNLRSINLAYLGMPDQLLTLKWKLHRAIVNARKLDKEKQAKLESQRSWMKQYVQSLPANKFFTHERALFALEERFADPLACTLGYPMTDEQFEAFRQGLQKYAPQRELNYVVSYIVQQSLNAQYRDFTDFETPFKDRVVSYGAGRVVHLGFEQNRLFESSLRSISDVENSGTVVDATTGFLITAPKEYREGNELQSWLGEKGKGDFGFDDANGGGLFAVRGAKLARLDVKTWHEADAIGNKDLRALLNKASAGSVVQLKKHYQDYQQDNGAPYCYAGVLTKEGRLAVVAVEDFSGRSRIAVRTRVRAAVPAMKNVTRSGENGFPGHRIEGGTVKEEGGSDGNWGEGTEGVQLKIHSLDVQFVKGQWKVKCKTDIRSSEERVLPPHGAPIGEYVIEWDGKWYRPVWSISGSSLAPLRAFNRNSMHTEIEAHGWVDEETGKPLLLSAGTHTLRIALPIVDSPEGAENQQSQKRAVSNKIDVTVPANQPDAVTWGSEKDGLLLGIDLADVQAMRNWQPGLKLSYKLWIKNASDQPIPVTDFIPLRGWYPELRDKDGKRVAMTMPLVSGLVEIRERSLASGAIAEVGQLSIDIPTNFKPGTYSLKQDYHIQSSSRDLFPLEVSVDLRIGELALGEAVGDVRIALAQKQHVAWTIEQPPQLVASILQQGPRNLLLSTVQMPESRLKVDGVVYRHLGEELIGVAYQPSSLRTDHVDGFSPKIVLDRNWLSVADGTPLHLDVGKHRVSYGWAGYFQTNEGQPDKDRPVLIWSGPTEVNVAAVAEKNKLDSDVAAEGQLTYLSASTTVNTLRIKGNHDQNGTVSGKVEGDFETYSVLLEHDNWKGKLGGLPQLVVKSGETYQFTNVPVGNCVVIAQPVLPVNKDRQRPTMLAKTVIKTVEVKDAQSVTVNLLVNKIRWDRLKPNNEHARVLREWGNVAYNEARGIGITQTSELPEIWVEVPPGSKSYEVRKDVRVTNATLDTTIYERPDLNQFWVQRDQVGSSFRTFFGPFNGDPFQVLGIQVNHAKNRIVGEWVGGGAIMPVFHTFSANRNYEKRIGERTADPERGAWQLEDNLLTRQFDGQEDSTQPIEWIDQNAFRIELPNDKSAVYRRVDAKTGNVILPEVSEGKKPITAAKNFADELLLIISKERGGQISPGGIGYSLDHEFLTIDQLQQSLKEKLEANPTRELLVRADPEVPYQMVEVALQLAKAAGVKNVRIASQVIDVQNYKDGGTTAFILHRPDQKPIRVCFDYRDRLPVEGSSWKIAGNLTLGRMFSGADYPANPNAQLVGIGSKEEKRLLSGLNEWLDQQLSKELQTRMLSEARSAESLKRLAATMGKTVDELRELSSLLRKTRQYELVFVQSHGVYVTLQRQAEPQANPSRIPQFLISVVNRGEIEKLTLGRTDQAFELEVDGKWYRQVRFEYKSSPLPPGRIYESFPLTLDQRWLHDGTPLELSPGRHTIRVRCSVHPFGSDKAASLATSQPMTMIVGTDKVEKEAKPDPEKSKQGQTDQ